MGAAAIPVVSRFARDHRLPYATPSGVVLGAFLLRDARRRDIPQLCIILCLFPRI